jgi:uncharacterized protein
VTSTGGQRVAKGLRRVGVVAGVAWLLACGAMFALQRRLLFPAPPAQAYPPGWVVETSTAGLPMVRFAGDPMVVYLHGNASSVSRRPDVVRRLQEQGLGVLMVEYPGYAGAPGSPSEEGLYAAGRAALATLPTPPVCLGQSLGSGVATKLAAEDGCARVVLLAPYTSIAEVASDRYWFLPVRLLIRDPFDSLGRAAQVRVPTLVVQGDHDEVIAPALGRHLADALPNAELWVRPGFHHNDLWDQELSARIARFARGE